MTPERSAFRVYAVRGAAALLAIALAWACVSVNMERACAMRDTPYLIPCADTSSASPTPAHWRERIAASPGDTAAYISLLTIESESGNAALLETVSRLAPHDPEVLLVRATAAARRGDLPAAIEPLIELAEYRDSHTTAASALAAVITTGNGPLLARYITPGNHWFPLALRQLQRTPEALPTAVPLIAMGLRNGGLDAGIARGLVRDFKAAGKWRDAYALWLSLHPSGLPWLYNPSLEQPFERGVFDWESTATEDGRSVQFTRHLDGRRASVFEIKLMGRSLPTPLLRQYVFLGEGRYRLQGEYNANPLRMEQGLAWTVRCMDAVEPAARSTPLKETGNEWRSFAFEFALPPDCGAVASLQLETFAAFEARAGVRGQVRLGTLKLEQVARQ